jgi:hypothetical protein
MTSLAVYLFGHDLNKIAYPWKESIASASSLADAVFFAECSSSDGTWEDAQALAKKNPKLHLIQHSWGDHHTIQAKIANALLEEVGTRYDYALKLDADEVPCEWTFDAFRKTLEVMHNWQQGLARPHYTHFSPDFDTVFPFIYDSKAVISLTRLGLRYDLGKGGDACALGGASEYQTRLEIFHYGKVQTGREREALYKEHEFQKLYYDMGFPDPKVEAQMEQGWLDYNRVFDVSKSKGEFRRFTGVHPIFVQEWIAGMRERSAAFWKEQHEQQA